MCYLPDLSRRRALRIAALLLAILLLLPLVSCETPAEEPSDLPAAPRDTRPVIAVGYRTLDTDLNPFFVKTDCARTVMALTQLQLLAKDRSGEFIKNGIDGEERAFRDRTYTYRNCCDLTVRFNEEDETAEYTVTLRDGLTFSDGVPLTTDDVLFSLYTVCDPSYQGSSPVRYMPVRGLDEYLTQTDTETCAEYSALFDSIARAGLSHLWNEQDPWTSEQQSLFIETVSEAWKDDLQSLTDYCVSNFASEYGKDLIGIPGSQIAASADYRVAFAMAAWGFAGLDEDGVYTTVLGSTYTLEGEDVPTLDDFYGEVYSVYEGDPRTYWDDVNGGEIDSDDVLFAARQQFMYRQGEDGTVDRITGITQVDRRTLKIVTDTYDAGDIYDLFDFPVAPLHHYGDPDLFDPDAGSFGFPRGDLSRVRSQTDLLGAGMYTLTSAKSALLSFAPNGNYYDALPDTPMLEITQIKADPVDTVLSGKTDIVTAEGSSAMIESIRSANANGMTDGDRLLTREAVLPYYGYIGMNTKTVRVGDDPTSEESVALRKAFATLFAAYREAAVDAYYGNAASILNYPVSSASYVSPDPTGEDYRTAYATDISGAPIYTSDMNTEARYSAALQAAIGYLEAAGFRFDEQLGQFTEAPEGASLEYEVIVPGNGTGDHPCSGIMRKAAESLGSVGITLKIVDPVSTSLLWERLHSGRQQIWCAARALSPEPDMRQIYSSSAVVENGGGNYYRIEDDVLDFYITTARLSSDRAFRIVSYRQCMDFLLDQAVEVPVYQREQLTVFASSRFDPQTVPADLTPDYPWYRELNLLRFSFGGDEPDDGTDP